MLNSICSVVFFEKKFEMQMVTRSGGWIFDKPSQSKTQDTFLKILWKMMKLPRQMIPRPHDHQHCGMRSIASVMLNWQMQSALPRS